MGKHFTKRTQSHRNATLDRICKVLPKTRGTTTAHIADTVGVTKRQALYDLLALAEAGKCVRVGARRWKAAPTQEAAHVKAADPVLGGPLVDVPKETPIEVVIRLREIGLVRVVWSQP